MRAVRQLNRAAPRGVHVAPPARRRRAPGGPPRFAAGAGARPGSLPEFDYQRRWNLDKDGSLWIVTPGSAEQVGSIHTCQGLELDCVGVVIGPDLAYRDGRIVTDATQRASSDQSVKGLKSMLKTQRECALALADAIVKNTRRTLMTRGMKDCYVYSSRLASDRPTPIRPAPARRTRPRRCQPRPF